MNNKLGIICLIFSLSVFSQDKLSYLKDAILLQKIDSFASQEKYKEIINVLDLVNENDSIIHLVNIKKSYYYLQLKEYEKTIAICDKGISGATSDGDIVSFYINKAIAYSKLDKFDEAIMVYNQAIKLYPKNSEFYRRRGSLHQEKGLLNKAYEDLQKAIIINPYNVDNHLILGDLFFIENKFAQALMVYNMYLLISPDGNNSFNVLNFLNNKFASKTNQNTKGITLTKDDEKFEEIDIFIENRIALNKDYKFKNKIKIAYTKQNHLLFSLLEDIEFEDDFFKKYYGSIYHWMIAQNSLDDFIYTTCYSIENEKYQKIVKKKGKDVIEFYALFKQEYLNNVEKRKEIFDGEKQEVYYSYEGGELVGIGEKKEDKYIGSWKFYNSYGKISAEGIFDENEERIGIWKWYYNHGGIKEESNYENGKPNGISKVYYSNGNLKIESNYKNDMLQGNYKYYNRNGSLEEEKNFENNELDGLYTSFYKAGKDLTEYKAIYKQGILEGELKQFFANGNLYYSTSFINGKKEGITSYYNKNNQLIKKYNSVEDLIEGEFVEYYNNGNVYQQGDYIKDEMEGDWNVYYANGDKYQFTQYKSNEINGLDQEYSQLGHLYQEFTYKKGKLYRASFYDQENKILYNEKKEQNELDFKGYGVLGNIKSEGLYNIKGGNKGVWKYYDRNGNLTETETYIDNEIEGGLVNYYKDGKIKSTTNYLEGVLNGYFVKYFHNGQMASQGHYHEGKQDKDYRSYYIDGTLKKKLYFHKDQLHGIQYFYKVDGSLDYTDNYEFGNLLKQVVYGKNEQDIITTLNYEKLGQNGPEVVTSYYHNGVVKNKINYVNGKAHGKALYYFPSGELNTQGIYWNGSKHKKWTWFYKNGAINKEIDYNTGDIDGDSKIYYKNGNLSSVETYLLGNEIGKSTRYIEDGKTVSYSVQYTHNKKDGESVFYDKKGNLQLIRYYKKGILIGYSYLDTQGKLLKMIPIDNETAKIIAYYKNGKKSREFEIKSGLFINNYKTYYFNGQLESEHFYVNNEQNGVHKEYFENGQLKELSNYLAGNMHGKYEEFYINGKIKEAFIYKNNEKIGVYQKYDESGKLIEKGTCINDEEFKDNE